MGKGTESEQHGIEPDAHARFVPSDPVQSSQGLVVTDVAQVASSRLQEAMLASTQGGPIAVDEDPNGGLAPRQALYDVRLSSREDGDVRNLSQEVPGTVTIDAKGVSPLARFFNHVVTVLRTVI